MNAADTASRIDIDEVISASPVIPVVVVDSVDAAVGISGALLAGGIRIVELTLRTPAALEAIAVVAREFPQLLVGAGTVVNPDQVEQVVAAGARFLVSPGSTPTLLEAMRSSGLPALPGASTVSEALALREAGFTTMKFFPAEPAGGAAFLASLNSPLPDLRFCPTGGIRADNASDYLALANVPCVGGSWLTPSALVEAADWAAITDLARAATSLR